MKALRSLAAGLSIAASMLAFSTNASAQTSILGRFEADVGNYAPVALGSDVTLDACNSQFVASTTSDSYSVCSITPATTVSYSWLIRNTDTGALTNIVNTAGTAGSNFVLSTGGAGDFIQTAGTYQLLLNVVTTAFQVNIDTGSGIIDGVFDFGTFGQANSASTGFVVALTVTPAAVPEPEGLLLLLPAMLYAVARRRRKNTV